MWTRSSKGALAAALLVAATVGCGSSGQTADADAGGDASAPCGDAAACTSAQVCVSQQSCGTPDCQPVPDAGDLPWHRETGLRRRLSGDVQLRGAPGCVRDGGRLHLRGIALLAGNVHRDDGKQSRLRRALTRAAR
jgi:hypothetical protein